MNKEIFVIGAWTDTREKERNLIEVIKDIKTKGYPVCLVTHCPVSKDLQELVDYHIYEKENVLSDDWKLVFWREINGVKEEKPSLVPYHGVACLMNIRNAIDILAAKKQYKYIHYREADLTYDFEAYMNVFGNDMLIHNKKALFVHYQDKNYRTDLFSVDIDWYNTVIPRAQSWEEYSVIPNPNLILEYWFTYQIQKHEELLADICFLDNFQIGNKWTQAHYVEWGNDIRPQLDFADAPQVMFQTGKWSNIDIDRRESFKKALELLYKNKKVNPNIVEIGTTRFLEDVRDGDSTSVWAWFISKYGGSYHGCDISKDCLKSCEQTLRKYITGSDRSTDVALTEGDGLIFLKNYNKPIDLLYLDAMDFLEGFYDSQIYHLQLLLEATSKITVGGYVMFDDVFDTDPFKGKADIVIPYLLGGGNFTCVHRGYQFIFRKDFQYVNKIG